MIYLELLLASLVGAWFWVINAEALVLAAGLARQGTPLLLALTTATGQTISFTLMLLLSHRILGRFQRIRRQVERLDMERLKGSTFLLLGAGSFLGMPPMTALSVASGLAQIPLHRFIPLCFAGRLVRFFLIAALPETVSRFL